MMPHHDKNPGGREICQKTLGTFKNYAQMSFRNSGLQTMIPQDKPGQADQIFLLSMTLQTLLSWEYKEPYYIAKKKKTQLEWQT